MNPHMLNPSPDLLSSALGIAEAKDRIGELKGTPQIPRLGQIDSLTPPPLLEGFISSSSLL